MSLELVPLGTLTVQLRRPIVLPDTPAGERWIVEVASAELTGDRLNATLEGTAAADWSVLSADRTATLDVRALLRTHDDALIFLTYGGRADFSKGFGTAYTAPRFDTGDERYRWLNVIQAVGKGELDGSTLRYELYELR